MGKIYYRQWGLERFSVYVNDVNTSNPDIATFIELSQSPYIEAPTEWTQYQFDLSSWEGYDSLRIAIHYQSDDMFVLQMDSFKIEGTLGIGDNVINNFEYFYNVSSKTLEMTKQPVIITVNDLYNLTKGTGAKIKRLALTLKFQRPSAVSVSMVLNKVCEKENLKIDEETIRSMAEAAKGDCESNNFINVTGWGDATTATLAPTSRALEAKVKVVLTCSLKASSLVQTSYGL